MPRVDILMPVFNAGRFLDEALRSIRAQTWTDFRLILINDGSTDDSADRCRAAAAADPRLLCIDQVNLGITRSLNRALALATAPFVARMDADDIAEPDRLAQQLRYLDAHPAVIALGTSVHSIDDRGARVNRYDPPALHADIERELLTGNGGAMIHPSLVFRLEALRQVGGYSDDLPFSQDLDLFLRLAEVGRLANLLSPLLRYRLHAQSSNFTHGPAKRALKEEILRRAAARRARPFVAPPVSPLLHERDPAATRREWALYASAHRQRHAAVRHLAGAFVRRPLALENLRAARIVLPRLFRPTGPAERRHTEPVNCHLEILRLAREHAGAATTVLEVAAGRSTFLRRLDWIPEKTALDGGNEPAIAAVRGLAGDFLAYPIDHRFDLVLCLHDLEGVGAPATVARRLLAAGSIVIVAAPCRRPESDPEAELLGWFGRPPLDWIRVADGDREHLICVYASPSSPG